MRNCNSFHWFIFGVFFGFAIIGDNITLDKVERCRTNLELCEIKHPNLYQAVTGE